MMMMMTTRVAVTLVQFGSDGCLLGLGRGACSELTLPKLVRLLLAPLL